MEKTFLEIREEKRQEVRELWKENFGEYPKKLTSEEKAERKTNAVFSYNVYGVKSNWL